jgi:serine/threonine protein kinase
MELIEDGSLYDRLHENKTVAVSDEEVWKWTLDIALGLHYLHTHRGEFIHGDLSSHNVLVGILNGVVNVRENDV